MIIKEIYYIVHGKKTHKDEMEYTFVKDNLVLWSFPPQNGGIVVPTYHWQLWSCKQGKIMMKDVQDDHGVMQVRMDKKATRKNIH